MGFLKQVVSDSRRPVNTIQQSLKVPSSQALPMPVEYDTSANIQGVERVQDTAKINGAKNDENANENSGFKASNLSSDSTARSARNNQKDTKSSIQNTYLNQSIVQQNIDKTEIKHGDNVTNEITNNTIENSVSNSHHETHLHASKVNKQINNFTHQSVHKALETHETQHNINQVINNRTLSDKNDGLLQSSLDASEAGLSNTNEESTKNSPAEKSKERVLNLSDSNVQQPDAKTNRKQTETSHITDSLASGIAREIVPAMNNTLGQNTGIRQQPSTRVHIGQVNVVVESPKAPASKSSNKRQYDASSRLFLRGL